MTADPSARRRISTTVRRAIRDILAGLVFVAFGLGFAVAAAGYDIGSPVQMGPGYFPLVLAIILIGLGGLIALKGVLRSDGEPIGAVPWRAIALVLLAVVVFGLTVRGLGLIASTLVATILAATASRRATLVKVGLIGMGLTIFCVLIFAVGLNLRLPLVGPWLQP